MVKTVVSTMMPTLQLVTELKGGHDDVVWQARWSPDGDYLATCGTDRSVCIWRRPPTNSLDRPWEVTTKLTGVHTRAVRAIAWSPCGRLLASAGFDATVAVWKRESGSPDFDQIALLEGHESEVKGLSWSPNGELLASCSRDRSIWLWGREVDDELGGGSAFDVDGDYSFECIDMLQTAHSQDIKAVSFHPTDSSLLASGGYDDIVSISREDGLGTCQWNSDQSLSGHTSTVWSVAFAPQPDSNDENCQNAATTRLASAGADGSVRLWKQDSLSGQKSLSLEGVLHVHSSCGSDLVQDDATYDPDPSPIYDVAWSSNGRLLATISGGYDRTLRIFGVSPPASSSGGVSIFTPGPIASQQLESDPNCVQFMPANYDDDKLVVAVTSDSPDISIYRIVGVNWGELL